MSQTNTRSGDIPVTAGDDLTGLEDRLVKLSNSTGKTVASLPAANAFTPTRAQFNSLNDAARIRTRWYCPLWDRGNPGRFHLTPKR